MNRFQTLEYGTVWNRAGEQAVGAGAFLGRTGTASKLPPSSPDRRLTPAALICWYTCSNQGFFTQPLTRVARMVCHLLKPSAVSVVLLVATAGQLMLSAASVSPAENAAWRADIERGNQLRAQHLYSAAESVFERALKRAEGFGDNDIRLAVSLNSLALTHHVQQNLHAAEPLYERSVGILRTALGPDHPETAKIFSSLHELYLQQQKFDRAQRVSTERLRVLEQIHGEDSRELTQVLNDLALVEFKQGNLLDAEDHQSRSLRILRAAPDTRSPQVAAALSSLGVILAADHRYSAAAVSFQEAAAIRASLPELAVEFGRDLSHLAQAYSKRMNFAEAERLAHQSIGGSTESARNRDVATAHNNLGEFYRLQRDYGAAEQSLRRAVEVWEAVNGPQGVETGVSVYNLAALYEEQGRLAEAKPLLERAAGILESELGAAHQTSRRARDAFESVCRRVNDGSCRSSYVSR